MSLRDRLDCLVDFVGKILLCLLPPSTCGSLHPTVFFRVCFPTLFAALLRDFLPQITSQISGTANSNKSAPARFAAGTRYLRKKGIAVLPITCARAPNPLPLCLRVHEDLFLSSVPQVLFPRCCEKCDPSRSYRMQDQRYCLQA